MYVILSLTHILVAHFLMRVAKAKSHLDLIFLCIKVHTYSMLGLPRCVSENIEIILENFFLESTELGKWPAITLYMRTYLS